MVVLDRGPLDFFLMPVPILGSHTFHQMTHSESTFVSHNVGFGEIMWVGVNIIIKCSISFVACFIPTEE